MKVRHTFWGKREDARARVSNWLTAALTLLSLIASSFVCAQPATTASLWGMVRYTGPRPSPTLIEMRGDKFCAQRQRERRLLREELVVGPQGELANAIVYVEDGPIARGRGAEGAQAIDLTMRDCIFVPRVVALRTGQPLRLWNEDRTLHTVNARPKKNPRLLRPLHGPEDSPVALGT